MNRKEFLDRLEMLLNNLPEEERKEAIQYYRDYFDDAGEENEAQIIEELESPEKVAAVIRTGMESGADDYSEYGEAGYTDTRFEEKKVPDGYESAWSGRETKEQKEPWSSDILKIILVIAIILVAIPIAGPILLGIICAVLGIVFGIAVAGIVLSVLGVSFIGVGIGRLVTFASGGIMMSGAGLILLALGMLITVIVIKIGAKLLPIVFGWIVKVLRKLFHGRTV